MNVASLIVATVAGYALGGLWYSPVLFGKRWMELMRFSKKDVQGGMTPTIIVYGILGTFLSAGALSFLVTSLDVRTWVAGAALGALCWLGFVGATHLNGVLYEKKPVQLFIINQLYLFLLLVMMGAILGGWR